MEKANGSTELADKLAELEAGEAIDSSGNVRRRSHYNGSGALIGYFTYTYDAEGWQKTVTAYDASGNRVDYGENTWEQIGSVIRETYYGEYIGEDTVWLQRIDSEYTDNEDGSSVEEQVYYDKDGSVLEHGRNYYDSEHRCIRIETYDLDGSLLSYHTFEYDEAGRDIRHNQYMADGTLVGYTTIEYGENGRETRVNSYDENGQLHWYTLKSYDADGNYLGGESYDANGVLQYSSVSG